MEILMKSLYNIKISIIKRLFELIQKLFKKTNIKDQLFSYSFNEHEYQNRLLF